MWFRAVTIVYGSFEKVFWRYGNSMRKNWERPHPTCQGVFFIEMKTSGIRQDVEQLSTHFFLLVVTRKTIVYHYLPLFYFFSVGHLVEMSFFTWSYHTNKLPYKNSKSKGTLPLDEFYWNSFGSLNTSSRSLFFLMLFLVILSHLWDYKGILRDRGTGMVNW